MHVNYPHVYMCLSWVYVLLYPPLTRPWITADTLTQLWMIVISGNRKRVSTKSLSTHLKNKTLLRLKRQIYRSDVSLHLFVQTVWGFNAPAGNSLLLSLCELQNSAPSGETVMWVMAPPRRGRKSRWFSWYFHWTRTDSIPPLSRLVPAQKNPQNLLTIWNKAEIRLLIRNVIYVSLVKVCIYLLGWSTVSWLHCDASAEWCTCTPFYG